MHIVNRTESMLLVTWRTLYLPRGRSQVVGLGLPEDGRLGPLSPGLISLHSAELYIGVSIGRFGQL